ncbi:iron-containing redox enzyme family protein [Nocardia sp. NPDC051570]|uniref:iron-containing redox enzyme family protein n=1 Tax=Nocardia sp. NPDC051570 TaxID=3364324 RepID=UPI003793E96E
MCTAHVVRPHERGSTTPSTRIARPRGRISAEIIRALTEFRPGTTTFTEELGSADPLGDDVQLGLHLCYELHYRGVGGADPDWEWDPALLRHRGELEWAFECTLRGQTTGDCDADAAMDAVSVEFIDEPGLSHYLRDDATWSQLREFFAIRSIYHLKEADPHAWVIPRLRGAAKAALVAVEFDEYGSGRPERMHSTLFANLLRAAELDDTYLGYLDQVPAESLAAVNFMSLCGLHRRLRGALVGLFAASEITTAPAARRTVQALERLGAPTDCVRFYAEHIEADAVHEQILRHNVVGEMLAAEPALAEDVVFGIEASSWLENQLAQRMMTSWCRGESSLLTVAPPTTIGT